MILVQVVIYLNLFIFYILIKSVSGTKTEEEKKRKIVLFKIKENQFLIGNMKNVEFTTTKMMGI